MALEPWVLVAAGCTAVGFTALAARGVLRLVSHVQEQRLARESQALAHWWAVLADVPGEILDAPLRRIVGRAMLGRLDHAVRLSSDHPFLRAQREAISGFVAGAPLDVRRARRHGHHDSQVGANRTRRLQALRALQALVDDSHRGQLLSHNERVTATGHIGRALATLEFLESRHASVEPAALRRMTRALGGSSAAGFGGSQPSSVFPTQ